MTFSPKQKTILKYVRKYNPLHIIMEGAVRSGKTFLNNIFFLAHVSRFQNEDKDFILTGKTIGTIDRNIIKSFRDQFGIKIKMDKHNKFRLYGNNVHCFGTDAKTSHEAITGFTSYGWYGNEMSLQHRNVVQECFNRCSGEGFRVIWDTNPDYPDHPIKRNYIDKTGVKLSSGRIRIKSWHFQLSDNIMLSEEYIENLKESTPPGMWYDRSIKGLWVAAEGVVYENFNRDIHVIDPFTIPDSWKIYRGIDWGFTNPFVCLWIAQDEDGRLFIFDEHYQSERLLEFHAKEIKKRKYDSLIIADHDPQDAMEMTRYGIYTQKANKEVHVGLQRVTKRLHVQKDGKPRLYVTANCQNTIREFQQYCWEETRDGRPIKEEPKKQNDHCMDTLRYIVNYIDSNVSWI